MLSASHQPHARMAAQEGEGVLQLQQFYIDCEAVLLLRGQAGQEYFQHLDPVGGE